VKPMISLCDDMSQAEINPDTNAVLMQLSLGISGQDDCRLGHTVVRS